jgi:hypothetical protein
MVWPITGAESYLAKLGKSMKREKLALCQRDCWRNIPITLTIRVLSVIAYFNYLGSNGHKKKKGHSAIQACSQTRYSRPASPSISSCVLETV